ALTEAEKYKVRPLAHWDKMPGEKEAGWVVELRGYTYNRNGPRFVLEGLVQALANAGVRDAAAPAAGATPAADVAKPESKDPVVGRVSHVALYRADASGTDLINSSFVASLLGGAGGGGPAGPGPGTGGPGTGGPGTGGPGLPPLKIGGPGGV